MLRKNLKKQVVFLAESNGIPLSKAGTNSRGFHADQLGGVYTREDRRNQGIAYWVMEALLGCLKESRNVATLFVKRDNTSAIALYEKLSFRIRDNYRISYYAYT